MTHRPRALRDFAIIPAYDDARAWAALAAGPHAGAVSSLINADRHQVWPWLLANGFRFYVPSDTALFLTPDGRTVYLERYLIRTPSPWNRDQRHSAYAHTPDGLSVRRRTVGYPVARPLSRYAPTLAALIGADR
ncbi:hypothetical protein [Brachybacterium phenoliresistens]|uniref:hypothetical protein n=1 Tax=Brachybacterium phenoliresistens TaxID=396014 RepID=UPI0031E336A4